MFLSDRSRASVKAASSKLRRFGMPSVLFPLATGEQPAHSAVIKMQAFLSGNNIIIYYFNNKVKRKM
jgi:hypothetical protein